MLATQPQPQCLGQHLFHSLENANAVAKFSSGAASLAKAPFLGSYLQLALLLKGSLLHFFLYLVPALACGQRALGVPCILASLASNRPLARPFRVQ